jgi:hypothetical protein
MSSPPCTHPFMLLPCLHTSFHGRPLPAHVLSVPPSTPPLHTIIPSQELPYVAELANQKRQIGAPPSTPIRRLTFAHLPPTNPKRRIGAPPSIPVIRTMATTITQPRAPTSASIRSATVPSGTHQRLSRSRTHSFKSTRESASLFTAFTSLITIFGPRAPTPGMNRSFRLASRSFLLGVLVAI